MWGEVVAWFVKLSTPIHLCTPPMQHQCTQNLRSVKFDNLTVSKCYDCVCIVVLGEEQVRN